MITHWALTTHTHRTERNVFAFSWMEGNTQHHYTYLNGIRKHFLSWDRSLVCCLWACAYVFYHPPRLHMYSCMYDYVIFTYIWEFKKTGKRSLHPFLFWKKNKAKWHLSTRKPLQAALWYSEKGGYNLGLLAPTYKHTSPTLNILKLTMPLMFDWVLFSP